MSELALARREVEVRAARPGLEDLVERLLELFRELYPAPEDVDATSADVVEAPAYSVTIVRWKALEGRWLYVRRLYVDAAMNCSYTWRLPLLGRSYSGNEVEFAKPVRIPVGTIPEIELEVVNLPEDPATAVDELLDALIVAWIRR